MGKLIDSNSKKSFKSKYIPKHLMDKNSDINPYQIYIHIGFSPSSYTCDCKYITPTISKAEMQWKH